MLQLIGIIAAVAVLAAGGCLLDLRLRPFGQCRRCGGSGRTALSTKRRFDNCKRCGGNGRRVRVLATVVRPELRRK